MAIDSFDYAIYKSTNLEYKYNVSLSYACALIEDLMNGTIQNWYIATFFQSSSDYIIKLTFFPVDVYKFYPVYDVNYKDDFIKLGKVTTTYDAVALIKQLGNVKIFEKQIDRNFNNFLDYEPYTKIKLYVPFFEEIILDGQAVYGKTVTGYISIDFVSGNATLYVYADNILLDTRNARLGVELAIGRTNADEQERNRQLFNIQFLGGVASAGLSAITGNYARMGASLIATGTKYITENIANDVRRMTSYKGSSGTRDTLSVDKDIKLIYERPTNVKYPNYHLIGKPTEQAFNNMENLTGFVRVGEIHFNAMGEKINMEEIDEIVSLLKSGVVL